MHIQFELGLQKLGSSARRKFLREEIDNFLNRAQDQFIQESVKVKEDNQGFETIQVDIDRIRPLIKVKNLVAAYIATYGDYSEYQVDLPSNYSYLISDRWKDSKVCSSNTSTTITKAYVVLPLPDSEEVAAPYYAQASIVMDDGSPSDTLVALADLPGYAGYSTVEQKFSIPQLMQETFQQYLNNSLLEDDATRVTDIYWERYKDLYFPGSFIILITPSTPPDTFGVLPTIIIDGDTTEADIVQAFEAVQKEAVSYKYITSRLVRSSKLDNVLQTEYYKPQPKSPVTSIDNSLLRAYVHTNRIVNSVDLTYIMQAQRINLTLQRNCQLASDFHQKLVDMAVQYAAGRIEQKDLYQITTLENKS